MCIVSHCEICNTTTHLKWQRKQSKLDFHTHILVSGPLRNIISLQKKIWTRFKLVRNWHLHLRGYLVSKETFYPKKPLLYSNSTLQIVQSFVSTDLTFLCLTAFYTEHDVGRWKALECETKKAVRKTVLEIKFFKMLYFNVGH